MGSRELIPCFALLVHIVFTLPTQLSVSHLSLSLSCFYLPNFLPHPTWGELVSGWVVLSNLLGLNHKSISGGTLGTENGQDQAVIYFLSFYLLISTISTEIWDVLCGVGLSCFNFQILPASQIHFKQAMSQGEVLAIKYILHKQCNPTSTKFPQHLFKQKVKGLRKAKTTTPTVFLPCLLKNQSQDDCNMQSTYICLSTTTQSNFSLFFGKIRQVGLADAWKVNTLKTLWRSV